MLTQAAFQLCPEAAAAGFQWLCFGEGAAAPTRAPRLSPEPARHAGRLLRGLHLAWRSDCQCPSVQESETTGC